MRGLYIHIPFCTRKCVYCDFVSFSGVEAYIGAYLEKVKEEATPFAGEEIATVFIGGGTPSLLAPEQMSGLLSFLHKNFRIASDAEITVEANPASVTAEKLSAWAGGGVNRVSMGAQSLSDEVLGQLGRAHSLRQLEDAASLVQKTGFAHFNLDLIFALPGQTLPAWEQTLHRVTDFGCDHVSCYSLTVEEHTPLGRAVARGEVTLPDEDIERQMYDATARILAKKQIDRYEISNYAKPNCQCRHNVGYWECNEYIGLGCAAHGYFEGRRYADPNTLEAYFKMVPARLRGEVLSAKEQMEERLFLGLRMTKGMDVKRFERDFSVDFASAYQKPLREYTRLGLITFDGTCLRLTQKGFDFCDTVAVGFMT